MTLTDLLHLFVRRLHLGFSALALIAGINATNAQTTVIQYNGALHLNGSPFTGGWTLLRLNQRKRVLSSGPRS